MSVEPGHVVLAPEMELCGAPEGTFAAATAIRSALDQDRRPPRPSPLRSAESETLLIAPQPRTSAFQLRSVHIERLPPALADLLGQCRTPQLAHQLRAYALERGGDPREVTEVIRSFRAEGVLLGDLEKI